MEFLTKSNLKSIRESFEGTINFGRLDEYVNESRKRSSYNSETTIFLSHKHDEKDYLKNAIAFFKRFGVDVYIDYNDSGMPKSTNGKTAARLKEQIVKNKKFVLLATEGSINSKWCNWELGLGDAHKYIANIALLVIKDDNVAWTGTEYLDIYPVIGKEYSWQDHYSVKFPDGSIQRLTSWLKS
jgi:hypothetical protein